MQLTGPQLRTLRWYLDHRHSPPTFGGFLRRFARVLVLWVAVGVVLSLVAIQIGWPELAYLFAGLVLGAILREARLHVSATQIWPAIAAAIDWERTERLVAEAEHRA
jgi:hypothetical protein